MASAAAALVTPSGGARISVNTFKAPLLDGMLRIPDEPAARVLALDLGPPCQSLLERIGANRPCRLEIADLVREGGLRSLNDTDAMEERGRSIVARLLPRPNREPIDLILCWDLPNYVNLKSLKLLIDVLSHRAAPGCKLHMLIAYSKREMAAAPGRYVLTTDGKLQQILESDELGPAPRYSPEDLGRAVGGFRYERGVLLANGMQEFVYAWPSEPGVESAF